MLCHFIPRKDGDGFKDQARNDKVFRQVRRPDNDIKETPLLFPPAIAVGIYAAGVTQ